MLYPVSSQSMFVNVKWLLLEPGRLPDIERLFTDYSRLITSAQQQRNTAATQFDCSEFHIRTLDQTGRTPRIEEPFTQEACLIGYLHQLLGILKSQCHPKCFARGGTFFIYEKSAIYLIVVKSDLYLLPSLPLAIRKHWCEFRVDI